MNIALSLSHRELVLIRVALISRLDRLKERKSPALRRSYSDTWRLCNRLFAIELAAEVDEAP